MGISVSLSNSVNLGIQDSTVTTFNSWLWRKGMFLCSLCIIFYDNTWSRVLESCIFCTPLSLKRDL